MAFETVKTAPQAKSHQSKWSKRFSNKIKNTRHSSGLGVNTKSINHIEHDEYLDESSGTHQGVTCLIIKTLGQEYDE